MEWNVGARVLQHKQDALVGLYQAVETISLNVWSPLSSDEAARYEQWHAACQYASHWVMSLTTVLSCTARLAECSHSTSG